MKRSLCSLHLARNFFWLWDITAWAAHVFFSPSATTVHFKRMLLKKQRLSTAGMVMVCFFSAVLEDIAKLPRSQKEHLADA